MNCENNFCIYNDKSKCIIEITELDAHGKCMECIQVDIEDDYLKEKKEELLKRFGY